MPADSSGLTWGQLVGAFLSGGGLVALGAAVRWAYSVRRQSRGDVIAEWAGMARGLKEENSELRGQIAGLGHQLAQAEQDCVERQDRIRAEWRAEVELLRSQVLRLRTFMGVQSEESRDQQEQIRLLKAGNHPLLVTAERDAAVIISEDNGRICFANEWAHTLFRYPEGDLVNRNVRDLVPERLRAAHDRAAAAALRQGMPANLDRIRSVYGLCRGGEEIPIDILLGFYETYGHVSCRAVIRFRREVSDDSIPVYASEAPVNPPAAPELAAGAPPPADPVPTQVVEPKS